MDALRQLFFGVFLTLSVVSGVIAVGILIAYGLHWIFSGSVGRFADDQTPFLRACLLCLTSTFLYRLIDD